MTRCYESIDILVNVKIELTINIYIYIYKPTNHSRLCTKY